MRRTRRYHLASIAKQIWTHPSNRGRRVRAMGRSVVWQVRKRTRRQPVLLDYFGLTVVGHPDSNSASNIVYFTERFDPDEMHVIEAILEPGDLFVDVGANIGTHSLLAATVVGADGAVLAFEPHPVAAARLRENAAVNDLEVVTVREVAVADTTGLVEFLAGFDVSNSILTPVDRGEPTISVASVTLDDELAGRRVALAKLDLEGFELAALRGAAARLRAADPPIWLIEVMEWQLQKAGASTAELLELLAEAGFGVHRYDSRSNRFAAITAAEPAQVTGNVWAIADGHAERLDERLRVHGPRR